MPPIDASKPIVLHTDVEERRGPRVTSHRARVRWYDEAGRRHSQSRSFADRQTALDWLTELSDAAEQGLNPDRFAQPLAECKHSVIPSVELSRRDPRVRARAAR
jgi:hypothetical protein